MHANQPSTTTNPTKLRYAACLRDFVYLKVQERWNVAGIEFTDKSKKTPLIKRGELNANKIILPPSKFHYRTKP